MMPKQNENCMIMINKGKKYLHSLIKNIIKTLAKLINKGTRTKILLEVKKCV